MDAHIALINAVRSPARWFLACWRLQKAADRLLTEITKLRGDLAARERELKFERETSRLLAIELNRANLKVESLETAQQSAKDGNKALLRFIATRHNVKVPIGGESPGDDQDQ